MYALERGLNMKWLGMLFAFFAAYALERRIDRRWTRFAVCGNRPLLDRVRAGQPRPKDWRVVAVPGSIVGTGQPLMKSA